MRQSHYSVAESSEISDPNDADKAGPNPQATIPQVKFLHSPSSCGKGRCISTVHVMITTESF